MKPQLTRNPPEPPWWRSLAISALLLLIVIAALCFAANDVLAGTREERLEIAKQSVVRAAVNCYAIEGIYPPTLAYLREHYGLSVDEREYIVHYEAFASNIMPIIEVFETGWRQ
ncbi:MAG: hypothetical protein AAGU74_10525 [Bacillota bacterium]